VLFLLRKGLTNGEIGGALGISPRTVEEYCRRIFFKLEVSNRAEAAGLRLDPSRAQAAAKKRSFAASRSDPSCERPLVLVPFIRSLDLPNTFAALPSLIERAGIVRARAVQHDEAIDALCELDTSRYRLDIYPMSTEGEMRSFGMSLFDVLELQAVWETRFWIHGASAPASQVRRLAARVSSAFLYGEIGASRGSRRLWDQALREIRRAQSAHVEGAQASVAHLLALASRSDSALPTLAAGLSGLSLARDFHVPNGDGGAALERCVALVEDCASPLRFPVLAKIHTWQCDLEGAHAQIQAARELVGDDLVLTAFQGVIAGQVDPTRGVDLLEGCVQDFSTFPPAYRAYCVTWLIEYLRTLDRCSEAIELGASCLPQLMAYPWERTKLSLELAACLAQRGSRTTARSLAAHLQADPDRDHVERVARSLSRSAQHLLRTSGILSATD